MSSSNCCFLTFIQISQEADEVFWYSHLFQKFPQFIVIHTGKGFGIVNKTEKDVFLELSCFFHDPEGVGIWSLVPLPFLKPAWTSGSSGFTYCWSLAWRILSITLQWSLWNVFTAHPEEPFCMHLDSHASKAMLKILQARLQQYVNHQLPDVQAGFRKGRGPEI